MDMSISLLDRVRQAIDSGKLALPTISPLAGLLMSMAQNDDYAIGEVERLILRDQVLAAQVLRAANSAFFGGLTPITTIRAAVVRLSLPQVVRLVLLVSERSKYRARDPNIDEKLRKLWCHSSATAAAAHWLARRLNFRSLEDQVFIGGLLHDVGQLAILRALDEIKNSEGSACDVSSSLVHEVLVTAHTSLGYDLLARWNIPDLYCRISRDHHSEEFDAADIALVIVRLANLATAKVGMSLHADPSLVLSDFPEAHCLGTNEVQLAELEIMLEDSAPVVA